MNKPAASVRPTELGNVEERTRIVSGARLTVALVVMVAVIVVGLTGLIFALVTRMFDATTPFTEADLEWKAKRGAIELSKTAELGLIVGDAEVVREAAKDYLASRDVVNILAYGDHDLAVFSYGEHGHEVAKVFALPAYQVHALDHRLVAWAPAKIEGQAVGRVAVAVSTQRLESGAELRRQMLQAALGGGVAAMLLCLLFVALYIVPVLRLTRIAFERLEHTTHAALEAARTKAQFLANMSHEIRTPMNAVVGLSRLMLGMPLGPKVRRYAEMIDASSRALLNIINDILDFSKIEAGKYEIMRAPTEPALIVQEVAELLAERAQTKNIDLVYRISPEAPRIVEADADRVRQVLTNLVGNAVKFTERGEVYIQLLAHHSAAGETQLRFEVRDSGAGVPEALREHIFEAFSQADGSLVRKHGGTGLGLTISKQLVNLMGGQLGVDSELGKGSCFWFSLPVVVIDPSSAVRAQPTSLGKRALVVCHNAHAAQAMHEHVAAWGMTAAVAESVEQAEQLLQGSLEHDKAFDIAVLCETSSGAQGPEIVARLRALAGTRCPPLVLLSLVREHPTRGELDREVVAQLAQPVRMSELYECLARILTPGSIRPVRGESGAQRAIRNFAGARVLVVDDNDMNQFVAVEQLTRLGCTVDQALNGQQALDKVLAYPYALVLMDCQMPVMDGYTATREIRAREQGRRTVIVALTAHALQGERDRVLQAGMDDYLTKPMRPATLQRMLERWIGSPESPTSGPSPQEVALVQHAAPDNDVEWELSDCATGLLKLLLEQVPTQLELMDGALATDDAAEARAHAHKLKGSLLTVSATTMASYAEQIQHIAESGDLTAADDLSVKLLSSYAALEKAVKEELARRARLQRSAGHV